MAIPRPSGVVMISKARRFLWSKNRSRIAPDDCLPMTSNALQNAWYGIESMDENVMDVTNEDGMDRVHIDGKRVSIVPRTPRSVKP